MAVILVSAFQRLLLYERAYGFTRLRTLTHVFMLWLGILLVVLVILELRSKLRYFALGILAATLGFGLTVNTLNIDAFIVNQNISRALTGSELDIGYLVILSNDSIPSLAHIYDDVHLPDDLRNEIGAVLACRAALITEQGNLPWQSFNVADNRARQVLSAYQDELNAYPVQKDENGRWYVKLAERKQPCSMSFWID